MIVKICANKDIIDAKMALDAGADLLGVLVGQNHSSVDFITKEKAKEIKEYVNGRASIVLVTHLTKSEEIIELTKYIGNEIIQLHSDINENEVEKIKKTLPNIKLIRLIHVDKQGNIHSKLLDNEIADYYLIDSFNLKTDQVGGTGITSDWHKCKEIIKKLNKPTFLAGGLTPENVKTAIKQANPYGVDVNTGCKDENGRKNFNKIKLFIKNAKCCT